MSILNYVCKSSACIFDKSASLEILVFEVFIILGVLLSIYLFSKVKSKAIPRFCILTLGVFIFEFFTNPLWMNYHLGRWAYIYQDVSWIITLGWSTLIFFAMFLVEKYFNDYSEFRKLVLTLTIMTLFGLLGESAVVNLGIRTYSPEAQEVIKNLYLPLLNTPLAALYYIPVFMSLVISFYKFWSVFLDHKMIAPFSKLHWHRKLGISLLGILLFEVMVDPMLINDNLPRWSYIYRDISVLMTGAWVLIIWTTIIIVDKLFPYINKAIKFFSYVILATAITLPLEALAVMTGIRKYAPSTATNFSGFNVPALSLPIEIPFAITFYLILIIGFMHYWTYYSNRIIKNK